jgi:hypothetical protein
LFTVKAQQQINALPTAFNIERSRDASQVVYKIHIDENGNLDPEMPVRAYWYRYSEDGRIEPITWIQEKLSYGLVFKTISVNEASFHFAAYDKKLFYLKKSGKSFNVFTYVNGRYVALNSIYVHFNGGTDWLPTVEYVKMYAKDIASAETITETIQP